MISNEHQHAFGEVDSSRTKDDDGLAISSIPTARLSRKENKQALPIRSCGKEEHPLIGRLWGGHIFQGQTHPSLDEICVLVHVHAQIDTLTNESCSPHNSDSRDANRQSISTITLSELT
mmetsp:Transcript_26203/g.39829  ORF Transcript_26203/g.39829 Transcript_26203/m.39829 type:complete len:119 (-) Transcript_26203:59-415(-)